MKKNIKILFITIGILLLSYLIIDTCLFNKIKKDLKNVPYVRINYIVLDYDKSKNADYSTQEYLDYLVNNYSTLIKLKKNGNYYYATANNINKTFYNEKLEKITFAYNDVTGHVIKDCSFDKNSKMLKIPTSYFNKRNMKIYKNTPIKLELVGRVKKNNYSKVIVKTKVSKIFTYSTSIKTISNVETPVLTLFKTNKGKYIKESDFVVYINDKKEILNPDTYHYDSKTGVIEFYDDSYYFKNIYVRFNKVSIIKNYILSIFNVFNNVEAATADVDGSITLSDGASLSDFDGISTTIENVEYYYDSQGSGYYHNGKYCNSSVSSQNDSRCNGSNYIPKSVTKNAIVVTKSKNSGSVDDFYLKLNIFTFTVGSGDNTKTLKVNLTGSYQWINAYCSSAHYNTNLSGALTLDVTATVSGSSIEFDFQSTQPITTQKATGKFKVKNQLYSVTIQKKLNDTDGTYANSTIWNKKGIRFRIYSTECKNSDAECANMEQSKRTDESGQVTFSGLSAGTYYIKEILSEQASSSISANNYYRDANCNGVDPLGSDPDNADKVIKVCVGPTCGDQDHPYTTNGTNGSDAYQYSYCNVSKRYTTSLKKVDADNPANAPLGGFTFRLYNASGDSQYGTTQEGTGIARFCNIVNNTTFSVEETGQKPDYWGPLSNPVILDAANTNLTAYPYYGGCNCVDSIVKSVGTPENNHFFYCMKVKKVDADTGAALGGATFSASNGTVTLSRTSSLAYGASNKTTIYRENASTGITTILTANHNNQFTITETQAPAGYAASSTPAYATPTKINANKKWSEISFEDCDNSLSDSASIVVKNSTLKINWYKVDEDDALVTNVSESGSAPEFTVTASDGSVVKHNGTKVATSNTAGTETRNCYQADPNGSYTTFVGDSNGQVCVRGVNSVNGSGQTLTYTVTETKPAKYHTFGSYKTRTGITPSADFAPISASNKFINLPTKFKFKKSVEDAEGSQEDETEYTINGVTKTLKELTTEELKKITFKVYPENSNNALSFVLVDGIYEYSGNTIDGPGTNGATTELHLNDAREFDIYHLPLGNYSIKEVDSSSCQIGTTTGYGNVTNPSTNPNSAASCDNSNGNTGACIGYYNPDYSTGSSHQFTIDTCSNKSATTEVCAAKTEEVSQSLVNKPTVVMLTKKDFYHYDDASDIIDSDRDQDSKESNVQFENAKERSDFDRIDFKIYEGQSTNALNLIYVGNRTEDLAGRSEVDCKSDKDYALYRYVPGLSLSTGVAADIFSGDIGDVNQTIHTCGGHIKIENLCRGNKYTFKEEKVPDDSVYVKEDTEDTPTQVCFTVPCSDQGTVTTSSTTHIINDKGTRIRFEKRDGKYNYLIPDETTTFEVYRCPKNNPNCHPTDYGTYDEERRKLVIDVDNAENDGLKLIKFAPRAYLSNDREDGTNAAHPVTSQTDVETQYQLYTAMSDSDASGKNKCSNDLGDTNCYVTSLHPDHGVLILRYLQASENQGYTYVLVETVAPKNYTMPSDANVETAFTITNQTVNVKSVDVPNKPTSVVLRKYDDKGNLLTGAKFRIYKKKDSASDPSKSCVAGLKAMDQPREDQPMKLKTVYEGIYEARETTDTNIITTCTNRDGQNCNELTGTLTHSKYIDDWVNLTAGSTTLVNSENDEKEIYTQIQEGEALIQYLEYNHCYIFEEVEAPEGYSLPAKEEDRWSMIEIKENDTYDHTTYKTFINMPTPYQFFKYDEFNKLLDGAKFKLQKLNSEKKYEDVTVSEDTAKEEELNDGSKVYKVDKNTSNLTIETHNGTAFIYYLSKGQYRVVETEAPAGKELGKNLNVATFFVNDKGEVYGNRIITNKEKTVKIKRKNSDTAEFIVNIQTGQTLIRYGLIISIITALIAALMIYNNKRK